MNWFPRMNDMYQPYQGPAELPYMAQMQIEDAIKGYVNFKRAKGKDPKTLTDIELALMTLRFVRPDVHYLGQINKRLIFEYETLVAQLPANFRKRKDLRSMTFVQMRLAYPELPKLSPASIDKYVLTFRAFIGWCQDADLMPPWRIPRFEGLDKAHSKDKRHPFNTEELTKLFSSPLFTGHAPDRETQLWRHRAGNQLAKDHLYWVPLVGLYTGMRLREIIQLWVTDVRHEGKSVYLDVNQDGDGKSLKNFASRRQVPLHQDLISLGFLDYLESIRQAGHQRVFPDARPTKAGAPADMFSKRFGRYLKAIGIKHSKLTFHSLRHTFIDQAARQARLPDHIIKALVGHADHTITFGTYGGRLDVAELAEAINKISYPYMGILSAEAKPSS